MKRSESGQLRAEMALAGRSVLDWQASLAREWGCERIICLCEAPSDTVLAIQHATEALGGEFHAVRNPIQLAALLRADDELVLLLDGLMPSRAVTAQAFEKERSLTKAVWTIPAIHALTDRFPHDFERVDAARSWAGMAVMRAAPAQKLAEMAPDSDAMSALLRLALQAQTPVRELDTALLGENGLLLATSYEAMQTRESALIEQSAPSHAWSGPSRALASVVTRKIAPKGLQTGPFASLAGGLSLMTAGAACGWLELGAIALAFAGFGALGIALGEVWSGLAARLLGQAPKPEVHRNIRRMQDGLAVITMILLLLAEDKPLEVLALPVIMMGLVRFASATGSRAARSFWADRAVQLLLLTVVAAFGVLPEAIAAIALAALAGLGLARRAN